MAAKVLLRALAHRYIRREQRNGPFFLQLDDLHASNIFVDNDWNVTCLLDLEWVNAMPAERLGAPYWLSGCAINGLQEGRLREFNQVREEFIDVFEDEEKSANHGLSLLTNIMRETWKSGSVWFWHSIMSINAMYPLFIDHICPRFAPRPSFKEEELLSKFWCEDAPKIV